MARRLILILLATAVVTAVSAGSASAEPPRFGIRAAWISSDLRGDPPGGPFFAVDFSSRSGVTAGAFARFDLVDRLGLQVEALYARRSASGSASVLVPQAPPGRGPGGFGQGPSFDPDSSYGPLPGSRHALSLQPRVDLLQVPVLLRYTLGSGSTRPVLFVGPSIAFKLGASLEAGVPGGFRPGDFDLVTDISDDVNAVNFGMVFGVGADIDVGRNQIVLDARYDLGLTDVFDHAARFPGYRPRYDPDGVLGRMGGGNLKWGGFALGVGFVF